ncbi:MAG TPA: phage holin family protein [Streptosporangiaceae bacterium]|nr:phage holin family protein [Streptosporangiaceae bacterium]
MTVNLQRRTEDMTARELTAHLGEQLSQLMKDEIALAKAEAFASARQVTLGGGMLGGAALTGLAGWLAMVAAAIAAIALAVPVWAACLAVGGALAALAGLLALLGARHVSRGTPPLTMTAASIRDGLHEVAARVRAARR